ncbi:hypothetical protein ACVMII_005049 [Bradyrhizobium diazoefficiens]
MAVVDGPMGLVEVAGAVEQVAELRAGEAVRSPVDLGRAAGPSFLFEERPVALGELAIEIAVVRNRDEAVFDEGRDRCIVDFVTCDHLVGDARQCRHLR